MRDDEVQPQQGTVENPQIFEEDVVCMKNNPDMVGIVNEVGWDQLSEEDYSENEGDEDYDEGYEDEEDDDEAEGEDTNKGEEGEAEAEADEADEGNVVEEEGENAEDEAEEGTEDDVDLPADHISVSWLPYGSESNTPASSVKVVDRCFLHGDIVARAHDPQGQTGTVIDVDMHVDIRFESGVKIYGLSTKQLEHVIPFQSGTYVAKDSWLGRVDECTVNVTVTFPGSGTCIIEDADPSILPPLEGPSDIEFSDNTYYPGMKVKTPPQTLRRATWISGGYNKKQTSGTVIAVEPHEVDVDWLTSVTGYSETPEASCKASSLTILDNFVHAGWAVGDRARYSHVEGENNLLEQSVENNIYNNLNNEDNNNKKQQKNDARYDTIYSRSVGKIICFDRNRKKWHEISLKLVQFGRPHVKLTINYSSSDNKKNKKSKSDDDNNNNNNNKKNKNKKNKNDPEEYTEDPMEDVSTAPALTKKEKKLLAEKLKTALFKRAVLDVAKNSCMVICTHTVLSICWQDGTITHKEKARKLVPVNNVLNSDFWPEDFVVEANTAGGIGRGRVGVIKKVDANSRICTVMWLPADGTAIEGEQPVEDVPIYNIAEHPDYEYRIGDIVVKLPGAEEDMLNEDYVGVGQILELKDGKLKVSWIDKTVTIVEPSQVYVINDDEYGVGPDQDIENAQWFDEGAWAYGEENPNGDQQEEVSTQTQNDVINQNNLFSNIGFSTIQTATNNVMEAFSRIRWWAADSGEQQSDPTLTTQQNDNTDIQQSNTTTTTTQNNTTTSTTDVNTTNATSNATSNATTPASTPQFPSFDILGEVTHHHYLNKVSPPNRAFSARIMKEWAILRKNLPAEYPYGIPQLYYYSPGEQLNPNLHKNGTVCLSLLGTWSGRGVETWQPETSNILQVVVSIQGLILGTTHPYFLEAGYDKLRGTASGLHNSRLYNETIFLLTLQSMITYILNPLPPPFTDLVRNHFIAKGKEILENSRVHLLDNTTTTNNNNTNYNTNNNNTTTNNNSKTTTNDNVNNTITNNTNKLNIYTTANRTNNNTSNNNTNNTTNNHTNNTTKTNNTTNTTNNNNNSTNNNNNTTHTADSGFSEEDNKFIYNPSVGFKKALAAILTKLENTLNTLS